jgi:hypothetical protein
MSLNFEDDQFVFSVDNVVATNVSVSSLTPTYQVYVGAGGELISQQPSFSSYYITQGIVLKSQIFQAGGQANVDISATNADHAIQGITLSPTNDSITFLNAGLYLVNYQSTVRLENPNGGQLQLNILVGNAIKGGNICFGTNSGAYGSMYIQTFVNVQPNDVLRVYCINTSTSAQAEVRYSQLSVVKVA